MGYGFPAAIGAKLGNPHKDVIVISGDGGMQMKEVRVDEKSSIDFRNYFFDFDIYRRRICSYKSWTGKCRICGCARNLDYNMFWVLPEWET